jgi:hypothetical protein
MKTNYRHRKKLKEQARLTRQAEKQQRRLAKPEQPDMAAGVADGVVPADVAAPSKAGA